MKVAKWLIALMAVMLLAACAEQTDQEKAEDAMKDAQKDAAKAVEGVEVPSMK